MQAPTRLTNIQLLSNGSEIPQMTQLHNR
jgi:hypothetical protein